MKKPLVLFSLLLFSILTSFAQGNSFHPKMAMATSKGKPVKYNGFGIGAIPSEHLMFGGNHISYRKFGFGISWRAGIRNYMINKEGFGDVNIDTAIANGWLTGNFKSSYSYSGCLNFVIPITKKIPLYLGAGAVRHRIISEVSAPYFAPGQTEWLLNTEKTQFEFTFNAGVFIPVYNRFVLNIGYDHLPQTFFLGFTIQDPFNYEDIDMW